MNETIFEDHEISAAVALITIEESGEFLVVRRSAHPDDPWSYQIALPGGKREADESLIDTATRETFEECGIKLKAPHEKLQPHIAGRFVNKDLWVQPFLFKLKQKPTIRLDQSELSAFYWVSEQEFTNEAFHGSKNISSIYPELNFPVFPVEENYIWGFTYSVLVKYFSKNGSFHLKAQFLKMIEIEKHNFDQDEFIN